MGTFLSLFLCDAARAVDVFGLDKQSARVAGLNVELEEPSEICTHYTYAQFARNVMTSERHCMSQILIPGLDPMEDKLRNTYACSQYARGK